MKEDYKFKLFGIDPAVPGGDRSVPPARQEGETPRTDDQCENNGIGLPLKMVSADFARTLERELSAKQAELETLKAAQVKSNAHIVEADGKILNPYALYHAMCKMEILCDESDAAKFGTISTSTLRAMIEEATPPVERSVDGE